MQFGQLLQLCCVQMLQISESVVIPEPATLGSVQMKNGVYNGTACALQWVLLQVGHPDLFVGPNFTLVGLFLACYHAQDGGFPATVTAQQPKFLTLIQAKGKLPKQNPLPETFTDGCYRDYIHGTKMQILSSMSTFVP